jgi:hypothetical protein
MSLTTDPKDPDLGHGHDIGPVPQNKKYLVLSEEERKKGFIRPVRRSYIHVGNKARGEIKLLTPEERRKHPGYYAIDWFDINETRSGSYITEKEYLSIKNTGYYGGCNTLTTMAQAIAETYARNPNFYGATYCCGCGRHISVHEFVWDGTDEIVGS